MEKSKSNKKMEPATLYQRLNISPAILNDFCQQAQIVELALFGSIIRDEFRPDSDIDILITFAPDRRISLLEFVGIEQQIEELCNRSVDLLEKPVVEKDDNWIRRNEILGNYQVIYESRPIISAEYR
ncbi:MAG: hypothetical protein Fur0025_33070 [Oscillatoriaceae cyanobacterium]